MIDIQGQRFGRLVVQHRAPAPRPNMQAFWMCLCDCGQSTVVRSADLRNGHARSCGCLRRDVFNGHRKRGSSPGKYQPAKHGLTGTVEYYAIQAAKQRCLTSSNKFYHHYGGRGIEYRLPLDMGEAVREVIAAIGPRPAGMSLDRIDNDGHYEIGNLRWATQSEQLKNQRRSRNAVPA